MRHVGALAFVLAQLFIVPAGAATLSQSSIGNWTIVADSNDNSGKFDYCAAWTTYHSNITLGFAIFSDFSWAITFRNQQWKLTSGTAYPVTLTIDKRKPLALTSSATDTMTVAVPMPNSADEFNAFAHGYHLTLSTSGGANFGFVLSDTAKVLPKLVDCVQSYEAQAAAQSSNPFAPAGAPASGGNSQQPATPQKAAPAVLGASPTTDPQAFADVLTQAGITGYTILSADEAKQDNADVAWKDSEIFGIFLTVDPSQNETLQGLDSTIIASTKQSCTNGQFSSSSTMDPTEPKALELSTTCAAGNQSIYSFITIFVGSNGGFDVTITASPTTDAQATDAKIRNVIYNVLEN